MAIQEPPDRRHSSTPERRDCSTPSLSDRVAQAASLAEGDAWEQAIDVYDELIGRYADEPGYAQMVAQMLNAKGYALGNHHRRVEAIEAFDKVITAFGARPSEDLEESVAEALVWKGRTYQGLGRPADAIEAFDEVIRRFEAPENPGVNARVASALANKAFALEELGEAEPAIRVHDELVLRFHSDPNASTRVVWSLHRKADILTSLGRVEDALQVYDELLSRFADSESDDAATGMATAALAKAGLLERAGRSNEAIVLYDAVIARLASTSEPGLLTQLSYAMLGKGKSLFTEERFEEAIEVLDDLLERFDPVSAELRKRIVLALNDKIACLNNLGRIEEAVATHRRLVEDFGEDAIVVFNETIRQVVVADEPWKREVLAGSLASKAALLCELNRRQEAIAVYSQLLETFENDDEPELVARVVDCAREAREHLLEDEQ